MDKIKVSAVKYTNSLPFIHGLQYYSPENLMSLSLDTPSECYNKLLSGQADVGLVPVVFKNHVSSVYQVSPYCIGADGKVLSVILVSECSPDEIKFINLDYQSRTSVMLTRLLCRDLWKISPQFRDARPGFEGAAFEEGEARLVIGDRAFPFHKKENINVTDLAEEWKRLTGLPFVFAFWGSVIKLNPGFENHFVKALDYGMSQKARLIRELSTQPEYKDINLHDYLHENIIHEISQEMKEGMNLFLLLIRNLRL